MRVSEEERRLQEEWHYRALNLLLVVIVAVGVQITGLAVESAEDEEKLVEQSASENIHARILSARNSVVPCRKPR